MRYPPHFLDEVRRSADPLRIIGEVVQLKRRGSRWIGLCPFHQEKTPSFSVSEEGLWYCFGCQAGGDLIRFVMDAEGLDFVEAVQAVAERSGIPVPEPEKESRRPEAGDGPRVERRRILAGLSAAESFYRRCLRDEDGGARARQFLERRGFGDEVIERFGLGYAPEGWENLRRRLGEAGYGDRELEAAGLVKARDGGTGYYDRLRDRVVFPIRDTRGRTIAFGGRVIDQGEPKYLNSPETAVFDKGRTLYGLDAGRDLMRQRGFALLVEGYFDLLACAQHGYGNVVAPLGTSFTEEHARLLHRFADKVVVAFDGDEAGLGAAERTVGVFLAEGFHVNVLRLPPGHDPDSFLVDEGPEAFREALRRSQPALEFLVERAGERSRLDTPQGKAAALEWLVGFVAGVSNRVERAEWFGRVAESLDIDRTLVEQAAAEALQHGSRPAARGPGAVGSGASVVPGRDRQRDAEGSGKSSGWRSRLVDTPPAERELLRALLEHPGWHESLDDVLDEDAIRDPRVRALVRVVGECRRAGEEVEPQRLLSRCEVEGAEAVLAAARLQDGEEVSFEAAHNSALGIRRDALKRRKAELKRSVDSALAAGRTDEVDELACRILALAQEIEEIDRGDPVLR